MNIQQKLSILADSAKYDAACTSSGVTRNRNGSGTGNGAGSTLASGICHSFSSDGRCISLLKILMTNICCFDCKYCVNRSSNDVERAFFTPMEIAELTMNFYRRNYIEGLFLSSAVLKNPDYTMELMVETIRMLRFDYRFAGYIHAKSIPGADPGLVRQLGELTDRMSANIELPSKESLAKLAPQKNYPSILSSMAVIQNGIQNRGQLPSPVPVRSNVSSGRSFVPAGQSTQMVIGATPENDRHIMTLAEDLYRSFHLKRIFYSAYIPVTSHPDLLPVTVPPLLREHRLYQADWLLRFYGFTARELLDDSHPDLDIRMDPKCDWALRHLDRFPVEINTVPYEVLLRIPGIGVRSAQKIVRSRREGLLDFEHLRKLGVVMKRAVFFITCKGRKSPGTVENAELLRSCLLKESDTRLVSLSTFGHSQGEMKPRQLSMFESSPENTIWLPGREDRQKCLTGEM